MVYPELRAKARKLRRGGYSYNLIVEKLGVAKSTLSYWLADIPYTPNAEVVERVGKARARSGEVKSAQKRKSIKEARLQAAKDVRKLSNRDLFMLGVGLYLGEGEKTNVVGVINSDPRIIRLAIRWLAETCGLTKENFTLAIHLYPDNNIEASLHFWARETGIPLSQFGKTQVDRRNNKKMAKRGKLKHGTAHLRVRSNGVTEHGVFLQRRIIGWMDHVLE